MMYAMEPRTHVFVRSFIISLSATLIAFSTGAPLGFLIGLKEFRLKPVIVSILNGLMGIPTVVRGLLLYLMFSRYGPLGFLGLLYTPTAIIIGEALLVFPIVSSLSLSLVERNKEVRELIQMIGLRGHQAYSMLIRELRVPLIASFFTAFSRAITELGIALIVGGNIEGYTRTITTAIALYTSMGLIDESIKLGLSLLFLIFFLSALARVLEARYYAEGRRDTV